MNNICSVGDCILLVHSNSMCKKHHTRWQRHGNPNYTMITPKGERIGEICSVDFCEKSVKYKGLCGLHYKRQWRHGDPTVSLINMSGVKSICSVDNCISPVRYPSTGLCHPHHMLFTRHGRTHKIVADSGSGTTNTAGYRMLTIEGQRVYEHIHLAEKALGKKLPAGAVVHHMNEDPSDNFTPFNLVICPDQAYHFLLHRRAQALLSKQTDRNPDDIGLAI